MSSSGTFVITPGNRAGNSEDDEDAIELGSQSENARADIIPAGMTRETAREILHKAAPSQHQYPPATAVATPQQNDASAAKKLSMQVPSPDARLVSRAIDASTEIVDLGASPPPHKLAETHSRQLLGKAAVEKGAKRVAKATELTQKLAKKQGVIADTSADGRKCQSKSSPVKTRTALQHDRKLMGKAHIKAGEPCHESCCTCSGEGGMVNGWHTAAMQCTSCRVHDFMKIQYPKRSKVNPSEENIGQCGIIGWKKKGVCRSNCRNRDLPAISNYISAHTAKSACDTSCLLFSEVNDLKVRSGSGTALTRFHYRDTTTTKVLNNGIEYNLSRVWCLFQKQVSCDVKVEAGTNKRQCSTTKALRCVAITSVKRHVTNMQAKTGDLNLQDVVGFNDFTVDEMHECSVAIDPCFMLAQNR